MKRKIAFLSAALALTVAGCLDLDNEFTLNPDGSGKVKIKCVSAPMSFNLTEKKSPEETMKSQVRETLEQSTGVDAWSDVSASIRDDGKTVFSAVAYFRDIEQLKLHVMGASSPISDLVFRKEANGAVSVEVKREQKEAKAAEPPGKLTEEQIKAKMKEERAKYQQGKPMMEAFLKDLKYRNRVNLPGTVGEAHNFKKVGASAVEVTFDGSLLLKVMDGIVMDDAYLRKAIEEGRDLDSAGPDNDGALTAKLFGEKAPIKAVTQGALKPAFNYEAEAAPARKNLPELLKKYGAAAGPVQAAAGQGFKSVRVGGVQLVHFTEGERGLRPFNHNEPGLSLSVIAELSGAALSAKEGKITRALSDTGDSLLPKSDFERRIHFPRLSEDKKAIIFDVQLSLPGPKVAGIKEVTGSIQYMVADKTKDVDLGISDFKKGSKGKEFGAQIEKIEAGFQEGKQALELKLNLSRDAVESVSFFDAAGKKLNAEQSGYSSSGGESTLNYQVTGKFPPKGKIVARVYDEPKTYDAPFTISNIDLLGRPMK
jgi:hypothetical protein